MAETVQPTAAQVPQYNDDNIVHLDDREHIRVGVGLRADVDFFCRDGINGRGRAGGHRG